MTGLVPFLAALGVVLFGACLWPWVAPGPADERPFDGDGS